MSCLGQVKALGKICGLIQQFPGQSNILKDFMEAQILVWYLELGAGF
jgi:hypothetical protein